MRRSVNQSHKYFLFSSKSKLYSACLLFTLLNLYFPLQIRTRSGKLSEGKNVFNLDFSVTWRPGSRPSLCNLARLACVGLSEATCSVKRAMAAAGAERRARAGDNQPDAMLVAENKHWDPAGSQTFLPLPASLPPEQAALCLVQHQNNKKQVV